MIDPLPFPLVNIAADSPRASGRAYGLACREKIGRAIATYRHLVLSMGTSELAMGQMLDAKLDATATNLPAIHEELLGVADGAGVAASDVMLLNARSELLSMPWHECTSAGIVAGRSATGYAALAQTWDWLAAVADTTVVVRTRRDKELSTLVFAEAGQLAKIGLNQMGLGVCLNFLHCPPGETRAARAGVPVHLLARAVLSTASVTEAVDLLRRTPRGGAVNLVIADKSGQAVTAEVSPLRVDVTRAENGIVVHANDFECKARPDAVSVTPRCSRMREMLGTSGVIDDARLWSALSDHAPGDARICHHPAGGFLATATLAAFVLHPAHGRMFARRGPTCANEDTAYEL